MVQTRRGGGEVKGEKSTEEKRVTRRNANARVVKENEKTPVKKSESAIQKKVSPTKKSPIKSLFITTSPGRTTFSSKLKTPTRRKEEGVDGITDRMKKCALEMSPPLSQDSAISSMSESPDSERDEMTPPPSDCIDPSTSSPHTPIVPLRGREKEFNQLISLVDESIVEKKPLTIYISGTPGTGKSATVSLVVKELEQAPRKIKTCKLTCTRLERSGNLCAAIMDSVGQPCSTTAATSKFKSFVSSLKKTFVLILDEADFVKEEALTTIFTMPTTVSSHLIVIGIANTIDLTARKLKKINLKNEPVRMVFGSYTKQQLSLILSHKMMTKNKRDGGEILDEVAIDLCAGKTAAVSGDLRMAESLMTETCKQLAREKEEQEKMEVDASKDENVPSTPLASVVPNRLKALRAVNSISSGVYSSPLSRARLPEQPRILLALCLKLSVGKKKTLTRGALMNEYMKASKSTHAKWTMVEGSDLQEAFDMLESQSYISLEKDQIRMQVDSTTARSVIHDNEIIEAIDLIL